MPHTQESTRICKHISMHIQETVIPKGKFKTECKQYLPHTSDSFTCTAYTLLSEQGQNLITPNLSEAYSAFYAAN